VKIFLMGATPRFDVSKFDSIADRLAQTGGNTGNQLIAYGLMKPLVYEEVSWDFHIGPERVSEEYDLILIAAANFLFPGFDLGGMAEFIERTRLPVAIVGLGAQSRDYSPRIALKPGTERLMRVVAERAPIIGVRGVFTSQVLEEMHIRNVQIVGCPCYYMNSEGDPLACERALSDRPKIAVNASRDVVGHAFDAQKMREVVAGLIQEAIRYDGIFVAQTEREEMVLAAGSDASETDVALERLGDYFADCIPDVESLKTWAKDHSRVYWSVEQWIDDMRELDLVVGTRFHGAMAALLAGTPAFVFCHDTRTREMSEFLGVPSASIDVVDRVDLREVYDRIDPDRFHARRAELLPAYKRFLEANGLQHRL
jgi:Polysaccharide pyruvyl transferase